MQTPSEPAPLEPYVEKATLEVAGTPFVWRVGIAAGVLALGLLAWALHTTIGPRGQALAGVFCFFGLVAMFSTNLRAVNWRTIGTGFGLQIVLALLVLKVPMVESALRAVKEVVINFIAYSDKGAAFVFGDLSSTNPESLMVKPDAHFFIFAFKALPPILFVSAFFTMLYHYGVLQWIVRGLSVLMTYLMRTSGAETLSVSANVFMGQTEAPLIVKPYVPRMTQSELFALMVSGFAHISGGMMVVYINYGADPVAVLTTSIMACPCSLYLAKLFRPEVSTPETGAGTQPKFAKSPYVNGVDAISSGGKDGLSLALNVAAMLVVFIAFVAMVDGILGWIGHALLGFGDPKAALELLISQPPLSLSFLLGKIFSPAAFLIGVEPADMNKVGTLLGSKLAINEHFAYLTMKIERLKNAAYMTPRSFTLAAFALTGFANFSSLGIQLGGIGAIAPSRRHDLARLGFTALYVGFLATLLNAAIAGVLLP